MATAVQKITLSSSRDIPFNKLVLSQSNVRRVKAGISIEDLAASIARRGLIQSISVFPVIDAEGNETGMFEVPAGGRRFRALEMLVKQKRLAKTVPVPCIVRERDGAILTVEVSLPENIERAPLHPLDQFRAFQDMRAKGIMTKDEIAAAVSFPYGVNHGLRALEGEPLDLTADEQATIEAPNAEYQKLEAEYEGADELSDAIDQRLGGIETAPAAFDERPVRFEPADIARAGAFVSIGHDGRLDVERSYVRPEDEAPEPADHIEDDGGEFFIFSAL